MLCARETAEKIFEHTVIGAYLHVISFTKLGKDTATKAYLEPSETYVMELFYKNS